MNKYQFISNNEDIIEYIEEMAQWIEKNSHYSLEDIEMLMIDDKMKIKQLFEPEPETVFHDSPAKWAELLASNWGIIQKRELEFV